MGFAVGSLVSCRGREWVVLPESAEDFLLLRPLGGTDQEIAGVYLPLEGGDVTAATFAPPDPTQVGDFRSGRILREAVRLGFRSSAGPFRSFARINVEPRPYQLVPLMMALKLDPVRLLIADDVGIGKTVEACLIARELLDRGEISRMAVLCPPHLAEQWQAELAEKFHIQAELVLSSTARRLEKNLFSIGQSLFDLYPFTIVSTEFIKSPRRREEFLRTCPEFVIVDEAHTVAHSAEKRSGRHLRHQLIAALSADSHRHLVLVTATPHSGDEGAFRSLLTLLRPDFADLPADLSGRENEAQRREVAQHLVQRRRGDVRDFMEQTTFPDREETEETYTLSADYRKLFNNILTYARERVLTDDGSQQRQRVRWWSALALLRSLASSPAAAAATLRSRSNTADATSVDEIDQRGERAVLDLDDDSAEIIDVAPGAQEGDDQPDSDRERLLRFARRAEKLRGTKHDNKLKRAIKLVKQLQKDGYTPIVFCRFIQTAEYVAEELRDALPNKVIVAAVTGLLPPAEREKRIIELAENERRVLVATDCLSEGINLQAYFDAVIHYDLSWNPTRHEQREGRVDRFGQPAPTVRAVTLYGTDNQIDGVVLDVLLRKHRTIRSSLGISVPLPANTGDVVQALMNGLLLRGGERLEANQMALPGMQDKTAAQLQLQWDRVSAREKRSRTMFAQHALKVDRVAAEWRRMREAIGTAVDVQRFVEDVITAEGGFAAEKKDGVHITLPNKLPLIEATGNHEKLVARFKLPVEEDQLYLTRTHPFVEGLATHTLDAALDPLLPSIAKRCGAIRTKAVDRRTVLLLLRFRFHILKQVDGVEQPLLAEACDVVAFTGRGANVTWLDEATAEELLNAPPAQNITPQQATANVERVLAMVADLQPQLNQLTEDRGADLLTAHRRVRSAARQTGVRYSVRPQLPPDLLGVYVLLPVIE